MRARSAALGGVRLGVARLRYLLLAPLLAVEPAFGASLIAGLQEGPRLFRLESQRQPLATLDFAFVLENPPALPAERGWIEGEAGWGRAHHLASWPISGPDRFDHFSIRWQGVWSTGEGSFEVRLRSDSMATFFVGGQEALVSRGSVGGVTTTLALEDRPHDLRVDSSHPTGDAFVALEWRTGDSAWVPLVPNLAAQDETKGWSGSYFFGSDFQSERFQRIDEAVFFNWGDRGPFNRPEDLPTASLRWSDAEDRLLASFSTNRAGVLHLRIRAASPTDTSVSFDRTLLGIDREGSDEVRIQFDQAGEMERDTEEPTLRFAMTPDRPLRFWETEGEVLNGGQVEYRLTRNEESEDRRRPRLEGAIAHLDATLGPQGRWWVAMLLDRVNRADPPKSSPTIESAAESQLSDLLSQWSEIFAPDLTADLQKALPLLEIAAGVSPFEEADEKAIHRFIESVALHPSEPSFPRKRESNGRPETFPAPWIPDRVGNDFHPERRVDWKVESLVDGLTRWVRDFRELQGLLALNEEGGFDFARMARAKADIEFRNLPFGDNGFTFRYSETRFRIENEEGCFLEFRGPVSVSGFRVTEKGEWEARIVGPERTLLETGPSARISGALWEGSPMLLTGQGVDRKRGFLPGREGVLRLIPTAGSEGIPGF